jgi:leucyl aminopeptidase
MRYSFIPNRKSTLGIIGYDLNNIESIDNLFKEVNNIASNINETEETILDLSQITDNSLRQNIIDYFILSSYNFKKIDNLKNVKLDDGTALYSNIGNISKECMRLIDMPPNQMNSDTLKDYIIQNNVKGINIEILEEEYLRTEGYNGILAINQGSIRPARIIIMRYGNGANPIVLIGKGVIFDSGGINIKMGDFSDMKSDKTGAIYVWGIIRALALSGSKGSFVGVIPLVENMPSSNAFHPGDIYTAKNGKTVEISNTDAEGRIILSDAICWANINIKTPSIIIDIATLTGQVGYIFGGFGTALMCNPIAKPFANSLIDLGEKNREYIWELPVHRVFKDGLNSYIADITNYKNDNKASTINAGMFLTQFLNDDNIPWIHLDIAGVAFNKKPTGVPMKTIYDFCNVLTLIWNET